MTVAVGRLHITVALAPERNPSPNVAPSNPECDASAYVAPSNAERALMRNEFARSVERSKGRWIFGGSRWM